MPVSTYQAPVYLTGIIAPAVIVAGQPGWLRLDGRTIGSAASGATSRANGDTFALYSALWAEYDNTRLPIQTSGGVAGLRGASAAADFAANKRMPLPNLGRDFIRNLDPVLDAGRLIGSHKDWQLARHKHVVSLQQLNSSGVDNSGKLGTGNQSPEGYIPDIDTGETGGTENGGENTPDNTAYPFFVHL